MTSDGRAAHRIETGLVLRERDHVAEVRLAREHHVIRSMPSAMPPCGGAPMPARRAGSRTWPAAPRASMPSRSKTRACRSGSWILNDPPPSSLPLTTGRRHAQAPRRIARRSVSSIRRSARVNGWCIAPQRCSSSSHSNIGKSVTQRNVNASVVDQAEDQRPRCSRSAPSTERHVVGGSATKSERLAGLHRERLQLLGREELRDRRPKLAASSSEGEPGETLRAALLGDLLELGDLCARERPRDADEAYGRRNRRRRRTREPRVAGGRILELELEAQVGLVRAEAAVGLGEGHPRERHRGSRCRALAPDRREHRSISAKRYSWSGKRQLDVELCDLLNAVGPQVLVPEADRDLVVAVEAGDHGQLLQDLRASAAARRTDPCAALLGTTKSRAPSGVGLNRIGVWMSRKPASSM